MVKNSKKNIKHNKKAMSGGKGQVSRYTQKFKQAYKRFMKIGDNDDDNSKLKKMEEWGRMRGIYKFLKFQNHKYTGDSGEEKNALEKMEDNINKTPNNTGYKSAISCFQQSENDILSGEGENSKCIPEEDYIKGVGGMETTVGESSPPVIAEAPTEEVTVPDDNAEAPTEEVTMPDDNAEAPTEEPITEAPTEEVTMPDDNAEAPTEEVTVPDDNADTVVTGDETSEPAPATTVAVDNNETETQEGGRSKRGPRSSRRRGKSIKSKKGRRTRRKHRSSRR
jgi:hypothetical protein